MASLHNNRRRGYIMADIKYEIKESIGALSGSAKGWKKE